MLDGSRQRPYDTVNPLADDLGLQVDTSCDRDDSKCVEKVVKGYAGSGNILLCWEHDALHNIVNELGFKGKTPDYPDNRYMTIQLDIQYLLSTYPLTASILSGLTLHHLKKLPARSLKIVLAWIRCWISKLDWKPELKGYVKL
jgi:hypothetical protein